MIGDIIAYICVFVLSYNLFGLLFKIKESTEKIESLLREKENHNESV